MIIEGSKVVKYIYDTGYQQFSGSSWEEAERKFESWINSNTPYRGLNMYAKHKGYYSIYETENGKRYTYSGITLYRIDEHYNIYNVDKNNIQYN